MMIKELIQQLQAYKNQNQDIYIASDEEGNSFMEIEEVATTNSLNPKNKKDYVIIFT